MKKLLTALTAALAMAWAFAPATASAQAKTHVMAGLGDTAAYFFAPDEIKVRGTVKTVRIYGVLAKGPMLDGRQAVFTSEDMEFDCATKNRSRHLTLAAYDKSWGLMAETSDADEWQARDPGSVAHDIIGAVCDYPKLIAENATFNADRRTLSETIYRVFNEPK